MTLWNPIACPTPRPPLFPLLLASAIVLAAAAFLAGKARAADDAPRDDVPRDARVHVISGATTDTDVDKLAQAISEPQGDTFLLMSPQGVIGYGALPALRRSVTHLQALATGVRDRCTEEAPCWLIVLLTPAKGV